MFREFSIGTFEMIFEREIGEKSFESIIKLILDTDYRENI
jgi:hypothetical protein